MPDGTGAPRDGAQDTTHDTIVHREPYEIIPRATLQDARLSLRARGLLGLMLSKPPGWRFATDRLAEECREGRDAVRTAMRELEAAGYVRRSTVQRGGRLGTRVEVAARPGLLPPATAFQASVRQASVGQAAERTQTESTETALLPLAALAPSAAPRPAPRGSTSSDPEGFADWWEVYPRKVGKRAAVKAYAAALKRAPAGVLLLAAARYRDDPHREDAYTPHPATWLNRDGWLDEPTPAKTAVRTKTSTVDRTQAILAKAYERAQAAEQHATDHGRPGLT